MWKTETVGSQWGAADHTQGGKVIAMPPPGTPEIQRQN